MPAQSRPVRWLDHVAVAATPAEIDISNAGQVRHHLLSVVKERPAALVVDMSQTTFCDSAGVNALVRVYQQARAAGLPVRLVITGSAVRRVLAITGVDRLIATFATVEAALAADSARQPEPHEQGSDQDSPVSTAQPPAREHSQQD